MTSDYKKYSLDKLQEWIHDAMNSDASPHEIYSAIREAVREDYYYHKDCISRATGLLELLSGHRPVKESSVLQCDKDDQREECKKSWNDFWEENYYPEEYQGSTVSSVQYTDEELNAMCDKAAADEKKDKVKKWVLPIQQSVIDGTDDYYVNFPDDLLDAANLKEGDKVEWVDQGDGSYLLKKVEKWTDPYKDQMLNAGYKMVDGVWLRPQDC